MATKWTTPNGHHGLILFTQVVSQNLGFTSPYQLVESTLQARYKSQFVSWKPIWLKPIPVSVLQVPISMTTAGYPCSFEGVLYFASTDKYIGRIGAQRECRILPRNKTQTLSQGSNLKPAKTVQKAVVTLLNTFWVEEKITCNRYYSKGNEISVISACDMGLAHYRVLVAQWKSIGVQNLKVLEWILHGDSVFFLCPMFMTRQKKHLSLFL